MTNFLAKLFGSKRSSTVYRSNRLEVESLESRNLMAASITLVGTQLQVHGTDNADIITISQVQTVRYAPTRIQAVVLDTQTNVALTRVFDSYLVSSLLIEAHNGNDSVENITSLPSTINGGAGDDLLVGGFAADTIHGNDGIDSIYGRNGADYLYGDAQADLILGGIGDDHIWGGDANDVLLGESGNDYISGGKGNDMLLGDGANLAVNGFPGMTVLVNIMEPLSTVMSGNDDLYGGDGDDNIQGQGGDDHLYGDAGNDVLMGFAGKDLLEGGTGDDLLSGGTGNDSLLGGDGSDHLYGDDGLDDFYYDNLDFIEGWWAGFYNPVSSNVVGSGIYDGFYYQA